VCFPTPVVCSHINASHFYLCIQILRDKLAIVGTEVPLCNLSKLITLDLLCFPVGLCSYDNVQVRAGWLINGKQKVVIPFAASSPAKYLILEQDGEEEFVQHCLRIQLP